MVQLIQLNDDDKKALIEAAEKEVAELVTARMASLLDTIQSAITKTKAELPQSARTRYHYPLFWLLMPLPLVFTIATYCWLQQHFPSFFADERLTETHYRIAILAFVVALDIPP